MAGTVAGAINWELGIGAATVSRYDPAGAVSTRQPVAFIRVRFPSSPENRDVSRDGRATTRQ